MKEASLEGVPSWGRVGAGRSGSSFLVTSTERALLRECLRGGGESPLDVPRSWFALSEWAETKELTLRSDLCELTLALLEPRCPSADRNASRSERILWERLSKSVGLLLR